jgi:hypothetical protein
MEKETAKRVKSDLSQHQIIECEALLGIAVKTVKGAKATNGQVDDLWRCVFDRWTSAKKPTMPRYKSRQAADSSVEVGVFKCDLSPGKVEYTYAFPPCLLLFFPNSLTNTL